MEKLDEGSIRYSEDFNDESAEITYQSSDHVRFRIHSLYLKAHSEVLAPAQGATFDEVAELTEPASILSLLFKFIYPNRQPVLDDGVRFDTVRQLAEAAEKYQVFPVMYVCYLHMHSVLPASALSILGFSLQHNYTDLMDAAAPYVIDESIPSIIDQIPIDSYKPWYQRKWVEVQKGALKTLAELDYYPPSTIVSLAEDLSVLRDETCDRSNASWWTKVAANIKGIPKLSTFLSSRPEAIASNSKQAEGRLGDRVIIKSSDGIQHYISLDVLQGCSKGFDDPLDGVIKVPEKTEVIGMLLNFIQPVRSPDLRSLPFEKLKELTYTAEKYSIYQATGICHIFMKKNLAAHPVEVFDYAAKYDYRDLLDLAAPLVIGARPFEESIITLPPALMVPWALYYQKWQDIARKTLLETINKDFTQDKELENAAGYNYNSYYSGHRNSNYYYGSGNKCCSKENFIQMHLTAAISVLCDGPGALRDLEKLFPSNSNCLRAGLRFHRCREMARKAIEQIPSVSHLLQQQL